MALKATWVEEKEDTPEAFALFAELVKEDLGKIIGRIVIYINMKSLLERRKNE